jgi:hypothetical protein
MPFVQGRQVRPDFGPTLANERAWIGVLVQADVFKSYIMILPAVPDSGKNTAELSDTELRAIIRVIRSRRLKTAFEVGGLRQGPEPVRRGEWGRQVAQGELIHLRRWLAAGGRIDYLTTDHALMMNLGAPYYQPGYRDCGLTLAEAADELADYFRVSSCSSAGSRSRTGPGPRPTRTRCWGCTGCCSSWGC